MHNRFFRGPRTIHGIYTKAESCPGTMGVKNAAYAIVFCAIRILGESATTLLFFADVGNRTIEDDLPAAWSRFSHVMSVTQKIVDVQEEASS